MKINTLKEIIKKKENKTEFAIITDLKTGESEIYEKGKQLRKDFEKYSDQINSFYNSKKNGVIEGKSFSFRVSQSTEGMPPAMRDRIGGNSFSQSFSGTIDGGSMEGTIMGIRGQGRPFSGQRKD